MPENKPKTNSDDGDDSDDSDGTFILLIDNCFKAKDPSY